MTRNFQGAKNFLLTSPISICFSGLPLLQLCIKELVTEAQ